MQRAIALVGAFAVAALAADLSAQTPDFAGQWSMVADANAPARGGGGGGAGGGGGGGRAGGGGGGGGGRAGGGMGGIGGAGLGMAATIVQDATTLTVTRMLGGAEVRSVYNLNGSPSTNTMAQGGNQIQQTSTAAWTGGKLVITTNVDMGGNQVQQTMALSLDGTTLVVETTGAGRGGGAPMTQTQRYTKGH